MSGTSIRNELAAVLSAAVLIAMPTSAAAHEDGVRIGEKPTQAQVNFAFEQEYIARIPYRIYKLPQVVQDYRDNAHPWKQPRGERPHQRKLRKLKNDPVVYEYLTN